MSDAPAARWLRTTRAAIQSTFFGYDFFISYRTVDGAACAHSLYDALKRRKFDCFLDAYHYEAGGSLPWMQSLALKRSRKLLVVVSPRAHVPPTTGTDWLLAEVQEFKRLAEERGRRPAIVSIGTADTLSAARFPDSKLLPEIPNPANHDICIFDPAAEQPVAVAPRTLDKLEIDFREFRRRRVRQVVSMMALAAIAFAIAFGIFSSYRAAAARRAEMRVDAFRLLDRGEYSRSADMLKELGLDPWMADHAQLAASMRRLRAERIAEIPREASHLELSKDGDWMLVVQDYQAPSGSPDIEEILDSEAFGVFHIPERKWTLKQLVGSAIGREVYEGPGQVVSFEPPDHLIVRADASGPLTRLSLVDGSRSVVQGAAEAESPSAFSSGGERSEKVAARLGSLLSTESLFRVDPDLGIDGDYGPRLVDRTYVESPDGRTALVGTYEGRVLLVDLVTGHSRGELEAGSPIYAAAYRPDGQWAYFADGSHLWQVDATGWPEIGELSSPLNQSAKYREVLGVALSEDGSTLALATEQRLFCWRAAAAEWVEWTLPRPIERVAALEVDSGVPRIVLVARDDGTIVSVNCAAPGSAPTVSPHPDGSRETVAWFDREKRSVWLALVRFVDGEAQVRSVPLDGKRGDTIELSLSVPDAKEETAAIHALARQDGTLIVVHGDEEYFSDWHSVLDERMAQIALDGSSEPFDRVLFEKQVHRNGPDTVSTCTHVSAVLPGSRHGSLFLQTRYSGVFSIDAQGQPEEEPFGTLSVREKSDGDESYLIGVDFTDDDLRLAVRHAGTGTKIDYPLPWISSGRGPEFAAIAADGRTLVILDSRGKGLRVDVPRQSELVPRTGG